MKTALVTGTSSGFGRGVVTGLLERGWHVFATLRRAEDRLDLFADDRARHGDRLVVLPLDVTREADRAAAARAVGPSLDCLVNNAGYALFGALEDMTEEQLRAQLEVNLVGAMLVTRALLPAVRAARGSVVNVSSVFGYCGFPLTTAYCASKFGLEGFSEALWHELRPHGARVHLVEPGGHRTSFSSNVEWARRPSAAYAQATRGYRALFDRLRSKPGNSPERVVATIVDLAVRPSSSLRVPVGGDARAVTLLKRLPETLALPAWGKAASRMLADGASAPRSARSTPEGEPS
jgi:NAD(P)-dependent dehydrogenase (short-subunit alcohol dehydrogenase family)